MSIKNAVAGIFGGVPQQAQPAQQNQLKQQSVTTTQWPATGSGQYITMQANSPYYSSITSSNIGIQWGPQKLVLHPPHSADTFKSLTAYIRSLLRCEPGCECKWCTATELDRQLAIAQLFKEEPEPADAK